MKILLMLMLCACNFMVLGCARTSIKKVVTGNEHGVRYYRPKPYLKLSASETKEGFVTVAMEHLPDFSEEYAIKAMTGWGTNDTEIKLRENGTLESLNTKTDAKFADNLNAITNLIKTLPTAGAKGTSDEVFNQDNTTSNFQIRAHKVPLGYYEAVLSRGPDCVKRLYGWRYVGFAPYLNCPMEGVGLEYKSCEDKLYGLVSIEGEMVFAALDDLVANPGTVAIHPQTARVGPDMAGSDMLDKVNQLLAKADSKLKLSPDDVTIERQEDTFVFTWKRDKILTKDEAKAYQKAAKKAAENEIPGGKAEFQ